MNKPSNDYLTLDFNLPNHAVELDNADLVIKKIKLNFNSCLISNKITDYNHTIMYEQTIKVLDYLGQLSTPAFNIETTIEDMYSTYYKNYPQLAKKLWMDHYEKIHHPYNTLKNRCFKLLDEIDDLYIKLNKKNPPNWKI